MQEADFQYLVRSCIQDADTDPNGFRRGVLLFAALGLAYVCFMLMAGSLLLYGAVSLFVETRRIFISLFLASGGLLLLWMAWRILWVRDALPEGFDITPDQAPELFRILGKLQKRLQAADIHRVIVIDDDKVFIHQQLRWGFWGKPTNTLALGLPLVLTIGANRMVSILAHEYAHLRGKEKDSKHFARLFRMHQSWTRLTRRVAGIRKQHGIYSMLTTAFMRWYAPRFVARSFAVARQEEYLADAYSARYCGAATTSAALIEIALLREHIHTGRWTQFWQMASQYAQPPTLPYAWLAANALRPPQPHIVQKAFHDLAFENTDYPDTRPGTADRVATLHQPLMIPEPSCRHAGLLLGDALLRAVSHYDRIWWKENRIAWSIAHQQAAQWLADIDALQQHIQQLQVPALERLVQLLQRTGQPQRIDAVYERIRQLEPDNAHILWRDAVEMAQRSDMDALPLLEQLAKNHPAYAELASVLALNVLDNHPEAPDRIAQRRHWLTQQDRCREQLRAWKAETQGAHLFANTSADHGLSTYELQDFIASAQRLPDVQKIWLLRKYSRAMPWRAMHLAVIEPVADLQMHLSMRHVQSTLAAPGALYCLHQDWLTRMDGSAHLADFGKPAFDRNRHATADRPATA